MELNEMESLEAVKKITDKFILPQFIKPCVALMLNDSFDKGQGLRNKVAFIIATELCRIGKDSKVVEKILLKWNEKNQPPLRYSEINGVIRSAYRRKYTFGCNHEILQQYCKIPEKQIACDYYRELLRLNNIKRKTNNRDFYKYNWQHKINLADQVVYFSLIELEKRRGIWAGSLLYIAHREIAKISGVSLQSIGKCLERLATHELIFYKPGEPYRWQAEASEIKRTIPIPQAAGKNEALGISKVGPINLIKVEHIIVLPNSG